MKKRIWISCMVVLLCVLSLPIAAEDGFVNAYVRFVDVAGLLTEEEGAALTARLDEISVRQSMDVTIMTTDTLDGDSAMEYADYAYEFFEFGYGDDRDGLLLLISIEEGEWWISTCGYGIKAFTDYGIQYIGDAIQPYLSDGDFVTAFDTYATLCDSFITQAREDEPFDIGEKPDEPLSVLWIPGALLMGFILAKIIVGNMKGKLKTVRAQKAANSYMKKDSMQITESRDLFLYHTVTRTAKANSSSSGGGSSTHQSASGTTHGGGGRKF